MSESFIIDTMQWSFSRLNSYYNCGYGWWLQYHECVKGEQNFFSQYGSFVHKILEMYAKNQLSIFDISQYYEDNFDNEITYQAPSNKYIDIRQSYYEKGLDYLDNIDLILDNYEVLGVEKEIHFKIKDYDFIGYIDLLLRDKVKNIISWDHKSATIKFLKDGKVSKPDEKHILEFKRQQYLYSKAIKEEYDVYPNKLAWNLFKDRKKYEIEFNETEFNEAVKWAEDTINLIENEQLWLPDSSNRYFCYNICNFRNAACEYKQ